MLSDGGEGCFDACFELRNPSHRLHTLGSLLNLIQQPFFRGRQIQQQWDRVDGHVRHAKSIDHASSKTGAVYQANRRPIEQSYRASVSLCMYVCMYIETHQSSALCGPSSNRTVWDSFCFESHFGFPKLDQLRI